LRRAYADGFLVLAEGLDVPLVERARIRQKGGGIISIKKSFPYFDVGDLGE
jgi:hypothetical protein